MLTEWGSAVVAGQVRLGPGEPSEVYSQGGGRTAALGPARVGQLLHFLPGGGDAQTPELDDQRPESLREAERSDSPFRVAPPTLISPGMWVQPGSVHPEVPPQA